MNYEHFRTQELLTAWKALDECQSRGVSDEIRINLIEKELEYRGITDYNHWVELYNSTEELK